MTSNQLSNLSKDTLAFTLASVSSVGHSFLPAASRQVAKSSTAGGEQLAYQASASVGNAVKVLPKHLSTPLCS